MSLNFPGFLNLKYLKLILVIGLLKNRSLIKDALRAGRKITSFGIKNLLILLLIRKKYC
jgi:hypothetical protein